MEPYKIYKNKNNWIAKWGDVNIETSSPHESIFAIMKLIKEFIVHNKKFKK